MLADASSSARGGRSSAASTGCPERNASRRPAKSGQYTEQVMSGAAAFLPAIPLVDRTLCDRGAFAAAQGARGRATPPGQAGRHAGVRLRRQQGAQDGARGRRRDCRRCRHADHLRRRAVQSRPGDGDHGGAPGAALRARRQWRTAGTAHGQRASRSHGRRGDALRPFARGPRARDGGGGRRRAAIGRPALRDSARCLDTARRRGVHRRRRRDARGHRSAGRHRSRLVVRRHAGGPRRRLRPCRHRNPRDRHQRG